MDGDTREVSSSRESLNCERRLSWLPAVGEEDGVAEDVDDCAQREAALHSQRKVIPQFAKTRQKLFVSRRFLRRQSIRDSPANSVMRVADCSPILARTVRSGGFRNAAKAFVLAVSMLANHRRNRRSVEPLGCTG